MIKKIKIANKLIGDGEPVFIIAEAGVNHQGSIKLAKELISAAKEAGADAIKFQTFKASEELTLETPKAKYQREGSNKNESYYEMIKKLELDKIAHKVLMGYCKEKGIIFLSTPSEAKSADLLNKLRVEAFKIGSNDIVTLPLLERIASYKKPIILSRGMATEKEITQALAVIRSKCGNEDVIILHCVSNYPAKLKDLNLGVIKTIKNKFNVLVGYSDHSEGLEAPIVATLFGAVVIEKHFTINKNLVGPDHKFSINVSELRQMVKRIREVEKLPEKEKEKKLRTIKNFKKMLGSSVIKPNKSEMKMRKYTRKSIVARRNVKKGKNITLDDIAFKRPALGLAPKFYREIIGRKAKFNVKKDEFITFKKLI